MIISDANEYRGVLRYQTANRLANFSPEGWQRPMNVPSYQVGFGLQVGFRATAAAPRLGWAQGDCPPLLPTQADGRRAHMHPARGTGILTCQCQRHQLVPVASGRPCGPATGTRLPRADAPTGRSRPASTRGRSAVTGTQQRVPGLCTNTKPDSESSTQWQGSEAARGLQTYIQLSTFMHV